MRTTLGALLVGAMLAGVGVEPSAQPPQPTFRGGIDVVQADAVVVDANGRQALGLASADFTLSVDGQPRVIDSVDYIAAGAVPSGPPGGGAPASAPAADRAAPPSRHVVFV